MKTLIPAIIFALAGLAVLLESQVPAGPTTSPPPSDDVTAMRAELDKANKLVAMLSESRGETCPCGKGKSCLVNETPKSNCSNPSPPAQCQPACKCDPTDAAKCAEGDCLAGARAVVAAVKPTPPVMDNAGPPKPATVAYRTVWVSTGRRRGYWANVPASGGSVTYTYTGGCAGGSCGRR